MKARKVLVAISILISLGLGVFAGQADYLGKEVLLTALLGLSAGLVGLWLLEVLELEVLEVESELLKAMGDLLPVLMILFILGYIFSRVIKVFF